MKIEPVGPPGKDERARPLSSRLFWFAALWVGGAAAVGAASYALRALIMPS